MDVLPCRHDVTLAAFCPNKETFYIKIQGQGLDLTKYVFKWYVTDTHGAVIDLSAYVTKSTTESAFMLEWPFILVNKEEYEGFHELYLRSTVSLTERGKIMEGDVFVEKSKARNFQI